MNFNKAFVLGNVTRDPELRHTTSGHAVATFGLATNRVWKDSSGQQQKQAEFHNIVAWGRLGEICSQYLKKGSLVFIEGRIQTRSWQDQQGQKRFRTEIVAETMQMGPRGTGFAGSGQDEKEKPVTDELATVELPGAEDEEEIKPEEIPF
ncbi:MAG: single-stranded DNA-binding protein [Candidatus Sungbacteria bacterium]|nr:single-stranded DNA-binding protein [Candidatus Sungbacteria bacterium]